MQGSVAEDGSESQLPLGLLAGAGNGSEEGRSLEVEAVIDTGFDGELALPARKIGRLEYPYAGSAGGTLATITHGRPERTRLGADGCKLSVRVGRSSMTTGGTNTPKRTG